MARRSRRRQSRFVSLVCTDRQTDRPAHSHFSVVAFFVFLVFLCTATTQPPVHTTLDASLAVPLCHLGKQSPVVTDFTTEVADLFTPRIKTPCSHLCYNFTHDTFKKKKFQITKSSNPIGLEKKNLNKNLFPHLHTTLFNNPLYIIGGIYFVSY
jgi:hypothetical protein